MTDAQNLIETLDLGPHPEGGWYRQTWVAEVQEGQRPAGTAIYYLLEEGQRSHWHKVDATEIWHWYAGAEMHLSLAAQDAGPVETHLLSNAFADGARPQVIVPTGWWQSARPVGGWSLVGCTVSPGFQFDGFELAPVGWSPRV
ncbi:MAG: cupin domain-containing protein [Pseudomonadota bacterium]